MSVGLLARLQEAIYTRVPDNGTITDEGGLAIRLTNKTGAASVRGTVVEASTGTDNAFATAGASDVHPIGVVYEAGVADGSECWLVVAGRCQVLLKDTTAATRGYWVYTSDTGGRADATLANPPVGGAAELQIHMQEIGHCLESQGAGTDVLAYMILHFN